MKDPRDRRILEGYNIGVHTYSYYSVAMTTR